MLSEHAFVPALDSNEALRGARELLEGSGFTLIEAPRDGIVFQRGRRRPRLWSSFLELPQVGTVRWHEGLIGAAARIAPYGGERPQHAELLTELLLALELYLREESGTSQDEATRSVRALESRIVRDQSYQTVGGWILLAAVLLTVVAVALGVWALRK